MSENNKSPDEKVSPEVFAEAVRSLEQRVLNSQRLQIVSKDEECKMPLKRAVRHAAGMQLLRDKLNSQTLHMTYVFNSGINAFCVYFNNKPISGACDNLIIWKANLASLNRIEIAKSVAETLSVMLNVLGYEVVLADDKEPWDPLVKGKEDTKEEAPVAGSNADSNAGQKTPQETETIDGQTVPF